MITQTDGNVVIYTKSGQPIWATGTNGQGGGSTFKMQTDGHLVHYNRTNRAVWALVTHTSRNRMYGLAQFKPVKAVLENGGNLVLYSAKGTKIWDSKSGAVSLNTTGQSVKPTTPTNSGTEDTKTVTNVARGKKARQSSDWNPMFAGAAKAVDGNTDGNFKIGNMKNTITHTKDEASAWQEVDLGAVYDIESIKIWNRQDCCWERLQNFLVVMSKTPFVTKGNVTTGDEMYGSFSPWKAGMKNYTIDNSLV